MGGALPPPVAAVRNAVRASFDGLAPGDLVLVACSGGQDSLALAAALAFVAPRAGLRAGAVTVDHGLQEDSAERAAKVALTLRGLGPGLPVAGFSGTLSAGGSVFGGIGGTARGVVRAKTGNLTTVASLAGLVYDRSGDLLLFAIRAPNVPSADQLQQAADALDSAAAGLATCGCS